jgi:hypothetical protein
MITLLGTKVPAGRHAKGVFEASVTEAPHPDRGPRELRPLCYHPAAGPEVRRLPRRSETALTAGRGAVERPLQIPVARRLAKGSGIIPCSGKTAALVARMAWSRGSAGSYPDSKRA